MADDSIKVAYKGDKDFEILVKPDEALKYKEGEIENFENVLFVREVFTDAGAAERASADSLEEEFGSQDVLEIAKQIFDRGKLHLTAEQKNKKREEVRKRVVSMISRRAVNPKTNSPHPPKRIENALDEAGVNFDPMRPLEEQFDEAVTKIRPIIPISMEEKEVAIKIPNDYAGKCYGKIKTQANLLEEQWGNDAFMAKIKMPAGALKQLESEVQKICKGSATFKDL